MAENNFRADRLEEAIHTYGLDLRDDIKWDNEKMIKALGDYFMSLEPDKYSWGAKYVHSLNTVMLCEHLKKFLPQMGDINPMESEDYVAENKLNGMRCILTYSPETGFEFFTRRESVSNYLNGNITDKVLLFNKGIISKPESYKGTFKYRFVLDCEMLMKGLETEITTANISIEDYIQSIFSSGVERAIAFQKEGHPIKLEVFDVLYFCKEEDIKNCKEPEFNYEERELTPELVQWVEEHFKDFLKSAGFKGAGRAKKLYQYLIGLRGSDKFDTRRFSFKKRRELRHKVVTFLNNKGLPFYEVDSEDTYKMSFLEEILRSGGEGIIVKNLYAPYISDMRSSRGHRAAMKVKQSINNMLTSDPNLMEDFDVFITGANPPKSDRIKDMIGSLKCSIYLQKEDGSVVEHEIANVSGLSHEWKKKLAAVDVNSGKICLNPEYEGKVIAINGLALTQGNLKFQHATLKDNGKMEFKAKNPSECIWEETVLKGMTLTRGQ